MEEKVPLVDVSPLSKYTDTECTNNEFKADIEIQVLSKNIAEAFINWGFVYLTGHNIDNNLISNAFSSAERFFSLENSIKEEFLRGGGSVSAGFIPLNSESNNKLRPCDLRESFQFRKFYSKTNELEKVQPGFISKQNEVFTACVNLSVLLLKLVAFYLVPDDIDFFVSKHHMGSKDNLTYLRQCYYPPINNASDVLEDQLRCGEHTDFGTLTLLCQDCASGLQVVSPSGEYVDAPPIPGSVVVNIGDMLEMWSSGRFKATKHRVVLPNTLKTARQSMAFFVQPDNSAMVSCLDGSNKFPNVNALGYLQQKLGGLQDLYS